MENTNLGATTPEGFVAINTIVYGKGLNIVSDGVVQEYFNKFIWRVKNRIHKNILLGAESNHEDKDDDEK